MTEETQDQGEARKPLSLLASEQFGSQYHGEVSEAPIETPVETSEAEEVLEGEEATEAPETDAEEAEQAETEEAEETETVEYELSHIASMLGVEEDNLDVSDEGTVILRGKVDGEDVRVPVKDLLANHQKLTAADKRLEEAKARVATHKQEMTQATERLNEEFGVAARLIANAEKALTDETAAIDWTALRQDDPAEYAAKKAEVGERTKRIEAMKAEARTDYQKSISERQKAAEEEQKTYLRAEQDALLKALPEWKDQKVATTEKAGLAKYLMGEGFAQNEIGSASDHRIILLARKAMLYDQRQQKTEVAKKKVAKVPKVLKPGAHKPASQRNNEKIAEKRARLQKSGSLDDAFALLKARRTQ